MWTVGGRHDYQLTRTPDGWRIAGLTFTLQWAMVLMLAAVTRPSSASRSSRSVRTTTPPNRCIVPLSGLVLHVRALARCKPISKRRAPHAAGIELDKSRTRQAVTDDNSTSRTRIPGCSKRSLRQA
jgi:hypothetical protein